MNYSLQMNNIRTIAIGQTLTLLKKPLIHEFSLLYGGILKK